MRALKSEKYLIIIYTKNKIQFHNKTGNSQIKYIQEYPDENQFPL